MCSHWRHRRVAGEDTQVFSNPDARPQTSQEPLPCEAKHSKVFDGVHCMSASLGNMHNNGDGRARTPASILSSLSLVLGHALFAEGKYEDFAAGKESAATGKLTRFGLDVCAGE